LPSLQGPSPLPKDAVLVELRPDFLAFETRVCMLPGTILALSLVMEGRSLPMEVEVGQCLVVDKDRRGYRYRARIVLAQLPGADRHLIRLFITKGRGAPNILPPPRPRDRR
jgi:hypothetical protein